MATTIDAAWLIAHGPAPYYLLTASETYTLAVDVTVEGTAFFVLAPDVIFDLNGHTITYDNNTPPGLTNGGFETDPIGSTVITGWNTSGAAGAVIAAAMRGMWGTKMLVIPNIVIGQVATILSDPVTIPASPSFAEYTAMIMPKVSSNGSPTVTITVVDAVTLLPITTMAGSASGVSVDPQRGTLCYNRFVPASPGQSVRIKVVISAVGAAVTFCALDHADFTRSREYGVIATRGGVFGLNPTLLTATVTDNASSVNNATIKNGTIAGSIGRSYGGSPIYMQTTNFPVVDSIIASTSQPSSRVFDFFGSNHITVTNNSITSGYDMIDDRQAIYPAINCPSTHEFVVVTGNTLRGVMHQGIAVGRLVGDTFTAVTINNNDIRVTSNWTDGYGIWVNSVQNFEIAHNTVIPLNGRGLYVDGMDSAAVHGSTNDGTIHDNDCRAIEAPNLEYSYQGIEATALRVRNGTIKNVTFTNNTFIGTTGIGLAWAACGARISAVNALSDAGNFTNANNNSDCLYTGNTFRGIVTAKDPSYGGSQPSTAWGLTFSRVDAGTGITFTSNTFDSNSVSLNLGDNDSYGGIEQDISLISNTILKSSLGDQTLPYHSIVTGDWNNNVHNIRMIAMAYSGGAPSSPNAGIVFTGTNLNDNETGWLASITVHNGDATSAVAATVTIRDQFNTLVYTGTTNGSGQITSIPVLTTRYDQLTSNPAAITTTLYNPLTITAVSASGGFTATVSPSLIANTSYTLTFGGSPSVPDVLMMDPFTDTLGVLIIVPLYLNPNTTIGGPTLPTAVITPPTWTKNGSPIVFDLITFDAEIRAIVYQYPSWGHSLATDVITMSAPPGWATTVGGDLGGTGPGGTDSTPILVINNVGRTVETAYDTASRDMQLGVNMPHTNALGQPRTNWCSRLAPSGWTGVVTSFDATTSLPSAIGVAGVSCYLFQTSSNGIDSRGYPLANGRYRLTYGDAAPGVGPSTKHITVQLIGNTGWVAGASSPGTWDGAEWHDIWQEYVWTDPGTNTPSYIRLDLYSTASGGAVVFPDKGSGQVELCVTSPSAVNPNVANAADYAPLAIDSTYLKVNQELRPKALRFMDSNSTFDSSGDCFANQVADLALRAANDFSWAKQLPFPATTVNIIKVEPVTSWAAIIPYLGTTNAMTTANYDDFSSNVLLLCTTDVDHGLYTASQFGISPTTAAPNPVINTGLTLTGNITTTSGTTTIGVSDTTGIAGNFIQIGSEQLGVLSVLGPTSLSVSRGVNGTTGATHSSGATVYPGVSVGNTGGFAWVTGARTFVCARLVLATTPNTTIVGEVDFTPPNCPTFNFSEPPNSGSNPYEMQAKITNAIATANNIETILWTNVGLMTPVALVTEIVQNRIAPYLTSPYVTLIFELSNEIWNFQFQGAPCSFEFYRTAPNPETSGTGFPDQRSFIVSRQNQINQAAKAAFTAAGLSASRVYNFQPGKANNSFTQSEILGSLVYAQAYNIPIDYMSMGGYTGLVPANWTQFWSWMPTSVGGGSPWTVAYARQAAMSYMRAYFWFSPLMGVAMTGASQAMSWYQAGKSVANAGVGSDTANSGLGKLCVYEGATEIDADTNGDFINPIAMEHDWIADRYWKVTETAYFAAMQGASEMYRVLMPAASFPVAVAMDFVCYFNAISLASFVGNGLGEALYDLYDFQGQPHGDGASNVMGWSTTTPTFEAWRNESVRAQAIFDWNGGTTPPITGGGKSSNFAILMASM